MYKNLEYLFTFDKRVLDTSLRESLSLTKRIVFKKIMPIPDVVIESEAFLVLTTFACSPRDLAMSHVVCQASKIANKGVIIVPYPHLAWHRIIVPLLTAPVLEN